MIHGNRRDPDRYFESLVAAAEREARLEDTLLLAPGFRAEKDEHGPRSTFWSRSGWKIGNRSKDPGRISSFTVVDELLGRICPVEARPFPALKVVVIVGHSAGGQFVHRYAAGGAGCPDAGVEVRYVVMNPSSYLYVDGRRQAGPDRTFRVPRLGCFGFDDYKYGVRDLNAYMEAVGVERIRENLARRRVFYLAGEKDDNPRSGSLDKSCEARRQGEHRLERFEHYRNYAALFEDWTGSIFRVVPGVGHSGGKMLLSEAAREALFR